MASAATGIIVSPCRELYLYNTESSTPTDPDVTCVTCDLAVPGGDGSRNEAEFLEGNRVRRHSPTADHLNHPISEDGRYIFFSTAAPLALKTPTACRMPISTTPPLKKQTCLQPHRQIRLLFRGSLRRRTIAFFSHAFSSPAGHRQTRTISITRHIGGASQDRLPPTPLPVRRNTARPRCGLAPAVDPAGSSARFHGRATPSRSAARRASAAVKTHGGKTRCAAPHKHKQHKRNANGNGGPAVRISTPVSSRLGLLAAFTACACPRAGTFRMSRAAAPAPLRRHTHHSG